MLSNLLDNACKWAKSTVKIKSEPKNGAVVLTVDDDGPGPAPSMRDIVLQRGMRADEAALVQDSDWQSSVISPNSTQGVFRWKIPLWAA